MKVKSNEEQVNQQPNTPKSQFCDKKTDRRLTKGGRVANYMYQVLIVIMSGTMLLLGYKDNTGIHITETVFKVFSVIIGIIPVI